MPCGVPRCVQLQGSRLCPSCGAKRAAAFAAFLRDEVLEAVGHSMWTFSIPKMIRPFFLHHRKLLGSLCHAAWETVQELMAAVAGEVDGFRTGMVVAVQTAGDALGLHPHLHAIVPRGGWASGGAWVGSVPEVLQIGVGCHVSQRSQSSGPATGAARVLVEVVMFVPRGTCGQRSPSRLGGRCEIRELLGRGGAG